MKELYNQMVELLPLIDPIIPPTLESRKSESKDRVLQENEKQRNVFHHLKKVTKKSMTKSLKKPTSPEMRKLEKKLFKCLLDNV